MSAKFWARPTGVSCHQARRLENQAGEYDGQCLRTMTILALISRAALTMNILQREWRMKPITRF